MPGEITSTGTENTSAAAGSPSASSSTGAGGTANTASMGSNPATGDTAPSAPTSFVQALQNAETKLGSSANGQPGANPGTQQGQQPTDTTGAGTKVQIGPDGKPAAATQDDLSKDAAWMGIPESRRNTILQNARADERKEVLKAIGVESMEQFEERFGWARDLDGGKVTAAAGLVDKLYSNPVAFAVQLVNELLAHPQGGPVIRQQLGIGQPTNSNGAGSNGQAAAGGDWKAKLPKPVLRSEDGRAAYTHEQVIEAIEVALQHHNPTVTPDPRLDEVYGAMTALQEEREVTQIVHATREESRRVFEEMSKLPHFTENKGKILEIYKALPKPLKQKVGVIGALNIAYNKCLQQHVFPTLSQTIEQQVRERDRQKANGATGNVTTTGGQSAATTHRPTNPDELARHMEQLAARMSA